MLPSKPETSAADLADPIAFLRQAHDRQEAVCVALARLAGEGSAAIEPHAAAILAFLHGELGQHMADEEADLFPMLRERCPKGAGHRRMLDRLSREHALDDDLVDFMVQDLERLRQGREPDNPLHLSINMHAFAETQRRHLGWENDVVLPLAEAWLTDRDKAKLSRRFAARRNLAIA